MWEGDSGAGQQAQTRFASPRPIAWLVGLVLIYVVALFVLNAAAIATQVRWATDAVFLGLVELSLTAAAKLPSSLSSTAAAATAAVATGLILLARPYSLRRFGSFAGREQARPQVCRTTWGASSLAFVLQCVVALSVLRATNMAAPADAVVSAFLFAASVALLVLWGAALSNFVTATSRSGVRRVWQAQLGVIAFTGCLLLTETPDGGAHNLLATLALSLALVCTLLFSHPAERSAQ